MALTLVTGKPGSYKSAYVMDIALKTDKTRPIYFCNFRDLKLDSLVSQGYPAFEMSDFSDWVDCPDGSLIFIDEIQEFTRNVSTKAKTEELPEHFTLLEKHRHRGIDIFIVTQHPMFIHTHLRRLLESHIHMQRAVGLPYANKRQWHQVCNDPEDMKNATIQNGCTVEIYRPPSKVFDYYTSTVNDTHKFKVPRKLITYGVLVAIGLSLFFFFGYPFYKKFISKDDSSTSTSNSASAPVLDKVVQNPLPSTSVEKKTDINAGLVYNPYDPYSYKPLDNRPPIDFPRVKGIIIFDGRCYAYSQQGTRIDMPQKTCYKVFDDRPFDYLSSVGVPDV